MPWFFYTSIAVLIFVAVNMLQRIIGVKSKSVKASAVVFNFFGMLFAISLFLLTNQPSSLQLPTSSQAWFYLGLGALFYGLYEKGRFYTAKYLPASVLTIVFNVSIVMAFVGSAILYQEAETVNKIIGGVLILVALLLISFKGKNEQKHTTRWRMFVSIMICLVCGLGIMFDKKGATAFSPNIYSAFVWSIGFLVVCFPKIPIQDVKNEFKQNWKKQFLLAALNVAGYNLQLKAFELGDATSVIPLLQICSLLTVLAGTVFLKEKGHFVKKMVAAILGLIGVSLLV
jgi:drug/metabolite transporter (DMT)-like permease